MIRGRVECDGEFVVAWESIPTANSGREEIRAQRLLPTSGDEVGKNDFLLSDMGPEGGDAFGAHTPAVSINTTDGSLLAVWSGDDDENGRIDQLIDPDGGVGKGRRYFQRMRS